MSRYANVVRTGMSAEQAHAVIAQYLQSEGFELRQERSETVWRKGAGWLAAPQFIKAEPYNDGSVRVESWMAGLALLPGIYLGEMDPTVGAYGFAIKAALKPRISELERRLSAGAVPPPQVPPPPMG